MDTSKLLLLFLNHLLSCSGQENGSKSRFEDILSSFGFGVKAVALEQQTLAPLVDFQPNSSTKKIVTSSQPHKKETKTHDKKKFKDALEKFGFGKSNVKELSSKPKASVTFKTHTANGFSHAIKKDNKKHDKKKFEETLENFGFGKADTGDILPNSVPSFNSQKTPLQLSNKKDKNINKFESNKLPLTHSVVSGRSDVIPSTDSKIPLFVKVETNVSPNHKITPRESKTDLSQTTVTSVPQFIRDRYTERKQKKPINKVSKGKAIKKKKNLNKTFETSSAVPVNDPTFFVTPKKLVNKESKRKHGRKKSKNHDIVKSGIPTKVPSFENIKSSKSKNAQQNQKLQHTRGKVGFSGALSVSEQPILVTTKHPPVDFGEKTFSTQRPRHSRQQDLEDKTNALAALFNVAGKSNPKPTNPAQKKKPTAKKPIELNETNILREAFRQSLRGNVPVQKNKSNKTRNSDTKVQKQSSVTTQRSSFRQQKRPRKQNQSTVFSNSKDPLASLFSLIKDDGKENANKTPIKSSTREKTRKQPSRKSNLQVSVTPKSQSRTASRGSGGRNKFNAPSRQDVKRQKKKKKTSEIKSVNSVLVSTTQRSRPTPTPRRSNVKNKGTPRQSQHQSIKVSSTRRPQSQARPDNNQVTSTQRSISQPTHIKITAATKRRPQTQPNNIQITSTQRNRPQAAQNNIKEITTERNVQQSKQTGNGKGSKSRFDEILNKFGFGGKSVKLEQQTIQSQTTQTRRTNTGINSILVSKTQRNPPTTQTTPRKNGINIKSKSIGSVNQFQNNPGPNTTPFTVFRSPPTSPASPGRRTDAPSPPSIRLSTQGPLIPTFSSPIKIPQKELTKSTNSISSPQPRINISNPVQVKGKVSTSPGRGRGGARLSTDVSSSQFARLTQSSRGRDGSAGSTSSRRTPEQRRVPPSIINSSRQASRQTSFSSSKSSPSSTSISSGIGVLENLLQIAGNKEKNPVEASQKTTPSPTLPPNIPDRRLNIPLKRRPVNKNLEPIQNSISNPFIQQERDEPVQVSNIRISDTFRGRQNSKNNDIIEVNKIQAEQERNRNFASGRETTNALSRDTSQSRPAPDIVKQKRVQSPPRRPSIIIEDPDLNAVDDYDERDDDRRISLAVRHREKTEREERKRPKKNKQKKAPESRKARPPASQGCFHICDTLIFEVYKLLGGGLCDC